MGLEPTTPGLGSGSESSRACPPIPETALLSDAGRQAGDALPTFARLSVPVSFHVLSSRCSAAARPVLSFTGSLAMGDGVAEM